MNRVEIIAEIGKNWVVTKYEEPLDVLIERAKVLIWKAKLAGADVVKFQVHNVDDEINQEVKITSPHFDQDRYEWVKRNTYPVSFWWEIKRYCEEKNIEFLATPMSRGSAMVLDVIGAKMWKIGSGDILDFVMLDYIRRTGKPIILSSGMSSLEELKKAYNYLREKTQDVSILHCVSQYPCPLDKLNLGTISFLKKEFPEAKIGFSDHSLEISTGKMATQLGAEIIEKHFTLNRNAWGSDHQVSLEPDEFEQMVKKIKSKTVIKIPIQSVGVATKFLQEGEQKFRPIFHKGLYASRGIEKGKKLEPEDFYALRPKGDALRSEFYPDLLGTVAVKNYEKYESFK